MLDTVYCGYINFLIVLVLTSLIVLIFVSVMLVLVIMGNFSLIVFSLKFSFQYYFIDIEFILSTWNFIFLLMVLLIRTSVIAFSLRYINGLQVVNFVYLYLSFVIRIVWLILTNRFYWMIFGWDGLGVVSFLLIVFYMNQERTTNGLFTLFQNRVGDLFFVLFLVGLLAREIRLNLVLKTGLLVLLIGRSVKRAQFPFNAWLLAAIRAPTPISSLVHSSTLVVAGVYILLQYRYCLVDYLSVLIYLRVATLIISFIGLLNERDIKKLIAYSTIRHVGLIIFLIRLQLYKIVYFHLNIHAIFKSLMFMCFGYVMLVSFHAQDKRLVTLFSLNPAIKVIYYFSSLCLAGLPYLRAFFSKDLIIEKFLDRNSNLRLILLLLSFLGVSSYYSLKLIILTSVMFSYVLLEKYFLGCWRVLGIIVIRVLFINLYLNLVFRVTFEILRAKLFIYLFRFIFAVLSLLTNLNYKFRIYDKVNNIVEVWKVQFIVLEHYVYFHLLLLLNAIRRIIELKFFLIINWWVMLLVVYIF